MERARFASALKNWPMPIPLVHRNGAWYFDTPAGKQEILYRRVGRNELAAIQVCRELVDAEKEYYAQPHDGDLGNYLVGALPNLTYLGFTGTPIDKTAYGRGTFKVFGTEDPKGYLDKYSIAESIEDGTTVPLYYSIAPNELRLDREVLNREFLDLVEAKA